VTVKSVLLDRRAFLSGAGLAAGAVVATSLVPLSVVHALPASLRLSAAPECAAWHVDDVCGHWPPYSHAIGYGHRPEVALSITAYAEPVDHIFMV
jgi:hypothetical protein